MRQNESDGHTIAYNNTKQDDNSSSRSADSPPQVKKMADFRSPYIIHFFTPNLAAPNESMVDCLYAARIKNEKG